MPPVRDDYYGWLCAIDAARDARREAERQRRELHRETLALAAMTLLVLAVFFFLAQVTG